MVNLPLKDSLYQIFDIAAIFADVGKDLIDLPFVKNICVFTINIFADVALNQRASIGPFKIRPLPVSRRVNEKPIGLLP